MSSSRVFILTSDGSVPLSFFGDDVEASIIPKTHKNKTPSGPSRRHKGTMLGIVIIPFISPSLFGTDPQFAPNVHSGAL